MNVLFAVIITLSLILIIFKDPTLLLTAFSKGTENAVNLSINLICVYAVWFGINEILSSSGIDKKLAKLIKKPIKKLFNTDNEKVLELLSISITSNALGLGGISTPSSIDTKKLLDDDKNEKGKTMLFVISATSIQIFPLTVIELLSTHGHLSPYSIFLPTLICTTISSVIGIILVKIFT
jgi:spore maturation protein A